MDVQTFIAKMYVIFIYATECAHRKVGLSDQNGRISAVFSLVDIVFELFELVVIECDYGVDRPSFVRSVARTTIRRIV